jgi:hypothetical protein
MALSNKERQALYRERHIKRADGEKERLTLVLDAGTKAHLARIAAHYGYASVTDLIERWAVQTVSEIEEAIEREAKKETKRPRKRP